MMDVRFTIMEDMLKKLLEAKPNTATSEAKETTDGHGRGGNPSPFRGRKNQEVEILEGGDGMPPLEPLSREEISIGYEQKGADFARRGEDYYCQSLALSVRFPLLAVPFPLLVPVPCGGCSVPSAGSDSCAAPSFPPLAACPVAAFPGFCVAFSSAVLD
ncbi:hypothetical protein M5K25_002440 [Dendrobium thyrsiflorum]|uniref:Uncharacterized protein n=1 Tax=Dendrobium thyrsiflorum TaxID=117978 RepID=A0ABD0VNK9_DENTH